jgi:uncharacterized protein involved in exopolysaccharide biosynthesis
MSLSRQQQDTGRVHRRNEKLQPADARARIEAAFRRKAPKFHWSIPAIAAVWLMAAGYFFLMPPIYQSKWSLILPAANNGSTVSLETIGQTSTSPSHPFGSVSLSPKVIYKEIAASEQVRRMAAEAMGVSVQAFGKARVKLIDETSLMMFQMNGSTPEQAQSKARALMVAFEKQLDVLRRDELEKRESLVRENLKANRANLERVRAEMLEFQRTSGLLSLEQFKETSSSAEKLRQKLGAQQADLEMLLARQRRLMSRVGLSPELAARGIRLAADPMFGELADKYSKANAIAHESSGRYGPQHPKLRNAKLTAQAALDELLKIVRRSDESGTTDIGELLLVLNASHQSELFKEIVANESAVAGREREVEALKQELATLESKVAEMGRAAAKLQALQKDHLVAEAVFTSAAARLDINRTDLFASYPMVQVLAQPDLAENRSHPRLRYALAAGFLGTFFILLAWGAVWIRSRFGRRR